MTSPLPAVAVPPGINTATNPGNCGAAWLMVLTLTPGLDAEVAATDVLLVDVLPVDALLVRYRSTIDNSRLYLND